MKRAEQILLFLTLLFLPTQLGRHFWPEFSYIYSLKIDYLSPTIYFWDILALLLIFAFLFQRKAVNRKALNLWLFFLLSQLLSLLSHIGDPSYLGAGLVRIEQYLIAGLFGVYLASIDYVKVKGIIFWSLSLSILGESVLAIAQVLKKETLGLWILGERQFSLSTPAIAKFDFYGREFLRPYATFPHPNVLAGFLIIGLGIISAFWDQSKKVKLWSEAVIFLGFLATVISVSRTAILAAFFAAFILLRRKWLILVLVFFLFASPFLFTRYSSILNFDNLSILRRSQLSEVAINLWVSSPIFGVGFNNFIPQAANELLVGPSRFLQPVHNIFLLTLSETGVIGLLGLISLIGYPLLKQFQISNFKFQILTVWGMILFLGLFDHYFLTLPQGYRLLFLVWGLSLSMLE